MSAKISIAQCRSWFARWLAIQDGLIDSTESILRRFPTRKGILKTWSIVALSSLLTCWIINRLEGNELLATTGAENTQENGGKPDVNQPPASKETTPASQSVANEPSKTGSEKETKSKRESPKTDPPKSERQTVEERKAREAAKKRGELTFDDLKFPMEKGEDFKAEMITKENKELDKKTWKIRGFILPTTLFSQTNIKEFVLVRDNQECCFGPGAALYDCIIVTMAPGKSINYSTRVVAVKGKLEIDTESYQYPNGGHFAVYKMTAEEVK